MKIIANKQVQMTDEEWSNYMILVKAFSDSRTNGAMYFKDLFNTDERGHITSITPLVATPYAIIFFLQNVMINQRLDVIYSFEDTIKKLTEKINELENKIVVKNNE